MPASELKRQPTNKHLALSASVLDSATARFITNCVSTAFQVFKPTQTFIRQRICRVMAVSALVSLLTAEQRNPSNLPPTLETAPQRLRFEWAAIFVKTPRGWPVTMLVSWERNGNSAGNALSWSGLSYRICYGALEANRSCRVFTSGKHSVSPEHKRLWRI